MSKRPTYWPSSVLPCHVLRFIDLLHGQVISRCKLFWSFHTEKEYITITLSVTIQFHGAPVLWKTRNSKNKILYYVCFAFLYLPSHLALFRRSIRSSSANVADIPSRDGCKQKWQLRVFEVDGCLQKWLLKIANVDTVGDLEKCSLNMANVDRPAEAFTRYC